MDIQTARSYAEGPNLTHSEDNMAEALLWACDQIERLSQRLADEAGCMVCNFRERRACWEAGEKDKAEIDRLRSEIELKSRILGWLLNQRADGSVYIRYDEDAVLAAKTYFSLLRDETDTQTPCP